MLTQAERELARRVRDCAYLEGDFVLRSGRRSPYYLDKYRFETQPDLLGPIGQALAERARALDPEAHRLAGPELGAVALVAAVSLASGLPFLIVRKEAKGHGTQRALEGLADPGDRVCLIEDVVTSGGAALAAVDALRGAGLVCERAVCVVDREEGCREALAAQGVVLESLFRLKDIRVS